VKRFTARPRRAPHIERMSKPVSTALTARVELDNAELTTNSLDAPPRASWGFVAARPSEYLVVYRKGRIVEALCGQGGRFWKWPSDTYVVIPTTLKEVVFNANQVTTDFVDVRVRGMVVYRIVEPLRIYKLINFSDRPQAEAKLAQMISDLCRSLAKWLVANLRVEECLRRRKEEIAGTLTREVASIATDRWGVEIVTIDVQDVFIQDERLFQAMQATFRVEKDREARLAALEAERAVETRRLAGERELEKGRQELALEKAEREAQVELTRIDLARRRDEQQFALEQQRAAQDEALARLRLARARVVLETRALRHDEELRAYRERLAAESGAGRASLERLLLETTVPAVAKIFQR
jgi:hypothetical protein